MEKQTYCADDDSTTSYSGIVVCLVSCSFKPRLRKLAVCTAVVCVRRRKCESIGCQMTLESQRRPSCNARTFKHLLSLLDISDPGEEESGDDFYDADDGFVVADKKLLDTDPDFKVNEDEENMSENGTEDGISSQGCDEGPAEELLSNVTEKDELTGDEWEDESGDESEDESGDESENESEDESEDEAGDESEDESEDEAGDEAGDEQWEDAQEHFQTEPSIVVQCEPVQCEPVQCEPVQAAENCEPVQCEQVHLQL